MKQLALRARDALHRVRFVLFTAKLRVVLRAHGAKLVVDAPHGVKLAGAPTVEIDRWGAKGDARTTLRIGRGVTIGHDVAFELFPGGTNVLELGDRCVIQDTVRLQLRNGAIRLGPGTRVRSFAIIKSDGEIITAGDNEISYGTVIHSAARVEIGRATGLAEHVSIVDSDHTVDGGDGDWYEAPVRLGPVVIEDNVFIAAGAVITRGTRVGRNSLVAAGAVLTGQRSFPPGSLIAGAPARAVRALPNAPAQAPDSSDA